jgi:hypothetical protein
MRLIPLVLVLTACSSCSWLKSEAKATAGNVVDCTTASAKDAVTQYGPLMADVLVQATSDTGAVDWSRIKSTAKSLALETGACVLASTVARYLAPHTGSADAPQSEGLVVDATSLKLGWEQARNELYGGRQFKTEAGLL